MTDTTTAPTIDHQAQTPPDRTDAPKPLFTDFGVAQDLADELRSRGIVHPFPIQELTLPLGLKGHDIIGQARTGTGKTLGFGLPLIQRIDTSRAKTQALVIVPTRELCIQVADDLTVGAGRGVTSIAVYGGVGYDEQIEALTTGVHVVVGTPGRTLDHLGRGNLDVSKVHTVVLDEADEMLDMGFLPDVERLLADVPVDRQTLLFSATMPTAIVKLARRFMDKPTFMRADETLHETAPTVDQHFFLVHRMDKPRVLARLLQMPDRGGAFVFCRTKRMCDRLVQELDGLGLTAIAVHGDLRQSSREKNLDKFRAGKADVLVATEVAARGLDVSNVTHVVNYDCPDDEKMYLHRIGRTARAGESGVAVTFAEFNEVDRVNVIRKRVGTEEELTEVFSTSETLTDLFDLPATTPWDELGGSGSSDGSSGRSTSGSSRGSSRSSGRSSNSSGRSSNGTGGRGTRGSARATSSGSNRSSRRDTDRRGRSDDRRSAQSSSAASPSTDDQTSSSDRSSRRSSSDRSDRGRSRTRTRSRDGGGDRRDDRARDQQPTTRRDDTTTDTSTSDGGGGDTGTDSSSDRSPRSSGGRKRARRNRRRGGASSSDSTSTSSKDSSRGSGRDRASRGSNANRGGSNRSGSGRSGSNSTRDGSGRDGGTDRRSTSSRGRGDTSQAVQTTSRGSDARGDGTPRLDRRVDVEHLP